MFTITKYRHTRNFALYKGDELLAVTVYKKGAQRILQELQDTISYPLRDITPTLRIAETRETPETQNP